MLEMKLCDLGINETLKQAFAIYEANYPERLHSSYVINGKTLGY